MKYNDDEVTIELWAKIVADWYVELPTEFKNIVREITRLIDNAGNPD